MEGEVHGLLLSDGCLLGVICTARMWSKDRPKFVWNELLDAYALDPECELPTSGFDPRSASAHFQVKLEASSDVWFDVELPTDRRVKDEEAGASPSVSVKGDALGRAEQERWQGIVADAASSVQGSECVP